MQVFAVRMARTWPNKRRRKAVINYVGEMLYRMSVSNYDVFYPHIIDWDNSERFSAEEVAEEPWRRNMCKASYLCDYLKSHNGLAEYDQALSRETPDKDGSYDTVLLSAVQCCIRAACDVAVAPSGGVLGWTMGDLREMWAGRPLPKWVTDYFSVPADDIPNETPVWL